MLKYHSSVNMNILHNFLKEALREKGFKFVFYIFHQLQIKNSINMVHFIKQTLVFIMVLNGFLAFSQESVENPIVSKSLKTLDGKVFNFSEFKKNKASILVFSSPDCPISQKYTLTLRELSEKYKSQNIPVYLIISGTYYTKSVIKEYVKKYLLDFPVLLDSKLQITKMLEATITPEVFLFDDKANVLYSGRIDNWFESLGKNRFVITERDLINAVDSYLSGGEIKVKKTKAIGCIIQY